MNTSHTELQIHHLHLPFPDVQVTVLFAGVELLLHSLKRDLGWCTAVPEPAGWRAEKEQGHHPLSSRTVFFLPGRWTATENLNLSSEYPTTDGSRMWRVLTFPYSHWLPWKQNNRLENVKEFGFLIWVSSSSYFSLFQVQDSCAVGKVSMQATHYRPHCDVLSLRSLNYDVPGLTLFCSSDTICLYYPFEIQHFIILNYLMKYAICLKHCFASLGLMILFNISCLPESRCTLILQNFSFLFHIPCVLPSTLILCTISFNPVSPFLVSWPLLTTNTSTTQARIQYSEAGICEREKTFRNWLSEPSLTSFSSHFHNAISPGTEYNCSVYKTTFLWAILHLVVISTDYFFLLLCPCQQPIFTQGFLCPPQTSTQLVSPSSSQSAPY